MANSVGDSDLVSVVVDNPQERLQEIFHGDVSYDISERLSRIEQVASQLASAAREVPEKTAEFFTEEINLDLQLPEHLVPIYNAASRVFPPDEEPEYEPPDGFVSIFSDFPLEEALAFRRDPIFGYQVQHGDHSEAILSENIDAYIKQNSAMEAADILERLHTRAPGYAKRFLEAQFRNYQVLMSDPTVSALDALIAFVKYIQAYEIFCGRNEGAPRGLFEPRHYRKEAVRAVHAVAGEANSLRIMSAMSHKIQELDRKIEAAASPVELAVLKQEVTTLKNNVYQVIVFLARSKDVEDELVYKNEALAKGGMQNMFYMQNEGSISNVYFLDRLLSSIDRKLGIPEVPSVPRPRPTRNVEKVRRVTGRNGAGARASKAKPRRPSLAKNKLEVVPTGSRRHRGNVKN